MITDPIRACEAMLNQVIQGICLDEREQTFIITCSKGIITFDLDACEINIQVEDTQ